MITHEIKIVSLDETEYWNLPEYNDKIEKIRTIYWYNPNEVTHCCEITPSYCLYPYRTEAWIKDEFMDDDYLTDAIDNEIQTHADNQIEYMHCRTVDNMKSVTIEIETEDDYQDDEDWERKFEDTVTEYLHGGVDI